MLVITADIKSAIVGLPEVRAGAVDAVIENETTGPGRPVILQDPRSEFAALIGLAARHGALIDAEVLPQQQIP
mgnify:FL=1